MKGFLLGLLVAALMFGGYLFWRSREAGPSAVSARADAGAAKKKRKRGRGAVRVAHARGKPGLRPPEPEPDPEPEPEPEPVRLSAADRRMVGQGEDLSRPEVVRMDFGDERQQLPELSQDDIDERFRAQEEAVLDCIARARPDGEVYIPGLVNVKFRIQRTGSIKGVRVEGPAILMKGGLYGCVRGVVDRLRFPASGSSQIVTYPFRLS
jgi:hypothetical protein